MYHDSKDLAYSDSSNNNMWGFAVFVGCLSYCVLSLSAQCRRQLDLDDWVMYLEEERGCVRYLGAEDDEESDTDESDEESDTDEDDESDEADDEYVIPSEEDLQRLVTADAQQSILDKQEEEKGDDSDNEEEKVDDSDNEEEKDDNYDNEEEKKNDVISDEEKKEEETDDNSDNEEEKKNDGNEEEKKNDDNAEGKDYLWYSFPGHGVNAFIEEVSQGLGDEEKIQVFDTFTKYYELILEKNVINIALIIIRGTPPPIDACSERLKARLLAPVLWSNNQIGNLMPNAYTWMKCLKDWTSERD